jgi:uncharacterized protein (DUF4415 family)
VPSIIRLGGASFAALGTRDTPGTLIFTVSGDVARPGVFELEAGVSLRRVFDEVAGGPRPGRRFKAALCGVSGPVIPEEKFDTAADFASLKLIGAGLGAAGFIVIDDAASVPRVAQGAARFLYVESCNQCSACKHGLGMASSALDEIFDPALATPDDLERALYGARSAPQGNRCFLPAQGAALVPSLLARFAEEFDAQVADPARASEPWPAPKFVDFDEATRTFSIDPDQARKLPNWTYEPIPSAAPPPPDTPRAHPSPGKPPKAPASVRLAPDVREALAEAARARGAEVEKLANEVLRAWIAERQPKG